MKKIWMLNHATDMLYRKRGKNVIIGAGTTVIKDILEEGTYVGVPARKVG